MLKNLLLLSIFSVVIAVTIVTINIYLGQLKTTVSPSVEKIISPISPSFDVQTIKELRQRISIPVNLNDKSEAKNSNENEIVNTATRSAKPSITASPTQAILP